MSKVKLNNKIIAVIIIAIILLYAYNSGALSNFIMQIVPGPEGVDCSLYSAVANYAVKVDGTTKTLVSGRGVPSVIGEVKPGDWIAYSDYSEYDIWGREFRKRAGYQWVRVDPKTPIIQAVIVNRETGLVESGINLQIRIRKPSFTDVNLHGDPLGRDPTRIEWYSYETQKTESGNTITWKHYEVYVVPVDFVIELSIRPTVDLSVGDFQHFDLWFVIDTIVWLNAFTKNQYALLREKPPEGVTISAYSFRGGFPIWAWVGAWEPWQVSGRDGNPDKWYDPADLQPDEKSELEQHLQLMPSYRGSEITLYTKPNYVYTRVFSSDIIKNPELLKQALASQIPNLPDPRLAQTVYFPITLINYGALKREGYNPFYPFGYWHKEYYPTSYLRARVLYAIYGEWVYLWTKSEAEKQQYKWENRSSVITGDKSLWDKFLERLESFFTDPWTLLWAGILGFFGVLIVLVILAVFAPGFLIGLGALLRVLGGRGGRWR